MRKRFFPLLLLAFAIQANAQKFYTYVMDLGPTYVQLAWGTTAGDNTIGRSAPSFGEATVEIANRKLISVGNSVTVGDLAPDHAYKYIVSLHGQMLGQGEIRTWAANSQRLTFFVVGDFGTGKGPQYSIARAMWQEYQRRAGTGNPVRFLLSLGDNVYGDIRGLGVGFSHTGASDARTGAQNSSSPMNRFSGAFRSSPRSAITMAMKPSAIATWRPSSTISRFLKTSPLAITISLMAGWLSSSPSIAPVIQIPARRGRDIWKTAPSSTGCNQNLPSPIRFG